MQVITVAAQACAVKRFNYNVGTRVRVVWIFYLHTAQNFGASQLHGVLPFLLHPLSGDEFYNLYIDLQDFYSLLVLLWYSARYEYEK